MKVVGGVGWGGVGGLVFVKFKDRSKPINNMKCEACNEEDLVQSHLMACSGYTNLREGLDMSDLGDLVTYVRKVLDVRSKSG